MLSAFAATSFSSSSSPTAAASAVDTHSAQGANRIALVCEYDPLFFRVCLRWRSKTLPRIHCPAHTPPPPCLSHTHTHKHTCKGNVATRGAPRFQTTKPVYEKSVIWEGGVVWAIFQMNCIFGVGCCGPIETVFVGMMTDASLCPEVMPTHILADNLSQTRRQARGFVTLRRASNFWAL